MIDFWIPIIPTLLLFLMLKTKMVYRILLSLLFFIVFPYIAFIFSTILYNLQCDLTDKIGYCPITDFTRKITIISNFLFSLFFTVILFVAYKKQSKKLFNYVFIFFILFTICLIIKFIIGSIHFYLIDTVGYSNFYTKILTLFDNYIISVILTVVLYLYLRVFKK